MKLTPITGTPAAGYFLKGDPNRYASFKEAVAARLDEARKPSLIFPRRGLGRPSAKSDEVYQLQLAGWCEAIKEIDSTLDFRISA